VKKVLIKEKDLLKKVAAILAKEKKGQYKVFACKTGSNDDTENYSDNEDSADYKKGSKDKPLAKEQQQKQGKSDIDIESNAVQEPVSEKSLEQAAQEKKSDEDQLAQTHT